MTIAGLDASEILELALLLVAVGALSGFLAGVFGIGGGAILVPVFYECFRLAGVPLDVRMPLCVGASLALLIPSSRPPPPAAGAVGQDRGAAVRRCLVAGGPRARPRPAFSFSSPPPPHGYS